ncbi:MAG: MFS transporter, partial [Bacteroidetes bacterium]|nr:MFS transporter [Bacteroidota bacterium]
MSIKVRLIIMNFLEFFVWGSWLISLGAYMFNVLHFTGVQVGSIYGTMGIASIITPALFGIVADRWLNAERVLGICHIIGAGLLLYASTVTDYPTLYIIMLLNSCFFMPTIGLNNTVSYILLEKRAFHIVKDFP